MYIFIYEPICSSIGCYLQRHRPTAALFISITHRWHFLCSILLVEDDRSNLAVNVGIRNELAELAGLGVSLKDNNAVVLLQANSNAGTSLVHGELARVATAASNILEDGELAIVANGVVDDRVGLDGARGAKSLDVEGVVATGRSKQELVVSL